MKLSIVYVALAAALHVASALPYRTTLPFFNLDGLPKCSRNCTNIRRTVEACVPPVALVTYEAKYVGCFCQSKLIHSDNDLGGICPQSCNKNDGKIIQETYEALCGIPSRSNTMLFSVAGPATSQTNTPTSNVPISTAQATFTPTHLSNTTSLPTDEAVQGYQGDYNDWGHRHWKIIVEVALPIIAIVLALVLWLTYVRHTRTREDRVAAYEREHPDEVALQRYHQAVFDTCQESKPIHIIDNSLRGQIRSILKREETTPTNGQEVFELQTVNRILQENCGVKLKGDRIVIDRKSKILHRRQRKRNYGSSIDDPLLPRFPPRSARQSQTPRQRTSSNTIASNTSQRSVYSPLGNDGGSYRSLAPPLPVRATAPRNQRTPAMLLPVVYKPPPAAARPVVLTRCPTTSLASQMQRSFTSPLLRTSPANMLDTPPLPTRPSTSRVRTENNARWHEDIAFRDEITRGSNGPISVWEIQKLRGGQ